MSRRPSVQPRWLDSMLQRWGRDLPGTRGWYNVNPMLKSGIPSTSTEYEPWEPTPDDFEHMSRAIDQLPKNLRDVINITYKPWVLNSLGVTPYVYLADKYGGAERTHQRWLHDAVKLIETLMNDMRQDARRVA